MDKIYLEYTLTPANYRAMSYFNSFAIRRLQAAFVIVAWATSVTLLLLELLQVVEPTRIMHICFLVVSISLPVLVLNLEYSVHKFRVYHCGKDAERRIAVFGDEGIRYSVVGGDDSMVESWSSLLQIFELRTIFIIYKDARHTVVIPKSELDDRRLGELRALMHSKLGRSYTVRYKEQ